MYKILLVEDELGLRENISALLEIKGYEVLPSVDGMDALKKLRTYKPNLIISDIMMPFLDGYELFKRVKEDENTRFIPFLFLTAKSDLSSIRQGMHLGADDYITKPFSSEDLLNSINTQLRKSELLNEKIDRVKKHIRQSLPHELRTPLIGILGFSEIILTEQNNLSKEEIIEMVDRISVSAQRLHNRIEKFLQLTELDLMTRNPETADASDCTISNEHVKAFISEQANLKSRIEDIHIHLEPMIIQIPCRILNLVIRELLENAVKFSSPGTKIIVEGIREVHEYSLAVTDQGIGMTADEIRSISEFNQFNRKDYVFDGNGLGLTFVKRAVEACGGSFRILSAKNEGTSVAMKFHLVE